MTKKMLIDATHKEETRVAVTDGNKLIEYDYESQSRKPLKGSIFLAKVTRVEPSLQAAFVNFGGNRHGFLPFSEIHPDYFKIPVADREALIAEQEALLKEHDEEEEALEEEKALEGEDAEDSLIVDAPEEIMDEEEKSEEELTGEEDKERENSEKSGRKAKKIPVIEKVDTEEEHDEEELEEAGEEYAEDNRSEEESAEGNSDSDKDDENQRRRGRRGRNRGRGRGRGRGGRSKNVDVVGGEDIDEQQRFRFNLRRKYKIQEVIKRGQIMLVQVNKEERGNKGAAVGSYLSLPGRYCVLMPNSPRAGGVSRKIANHQDRARMREIVKDLEIPKGMSVIVRTAGVARTKTEIKRDLDYLIRLWNNIRELTLESTAPAIVYEEADLIKRAIRDLYTRDIDEIHVAGDEGHASAKEFMKMMIPSHVKKVKQYEGDQLPLFHRYQIESQINEIGQPEVRLKSGGYLVINPTEALVSIDVNSGKATKGRHIEETALKTNLEAANEVARQLKLRDLGGLVVIDFIDMEDRRNNAKVERRMKEALSEDRARVQVGRISSFGLMELSRQRLSPSLTEAQYEKCKNCSGIGLVRTDDAMSIIVLRAIEEEGIRARAAQIIVEVSPRVALYILNYKRKKLAQIEDQYDMQVLLRVDDSMPASDYRVEVSMPASNDEVSEVIENTETVQEVREEDEENKKLSRRRGRRGGRGRHNNRTRKSGEDIFEEESDNTEYEHHQEAQRNEQNSRDRNSSDLKAEEKAEDSSEEKVDKKKKNYKSKKAEPKKEESKLEDAEEKDKKAASNQKASNDDDEKPHAKDYETVNAPPDQKKKGWWNRLVE
ncbi:MAG: Rne/Rng family ribonuclease [Alphaproteobacteria bacterium]|nr:Rne/Rng family ribonuclease [Alphaproteobacteria bacterium]